MFRIGEFSKIAQVSVGGKVPGSVRLSEERLLTVRELPAINTMATLAHIGRVNDSHSGSRR